MEVRLGLKCDEGVYRKAPIVHSIDRACNQFFLDKNYGGGIDNLDVGIIWFVNESALHPVRPLKFKKHAIVNFPPFPRKELFNWVTYDFKPDYSYVARHDGEDLLRFTCITFYESTEVLGRHSAKYPCFDVMTFRADLKRLLNC